MFQQDKNEIVSIYSNIRSIYFSKVLDASKSNSDKQKSFEHLGQTLITLLDRELTLIQSVFQEAYVPLAFKNTCKAGVDFFCDVFDQIQSKTKSSCLDKKDFQELFSLLDSIDSFDRQTQSFEEVFQVVDLSFLGWQF